MIIINQGRFWDKVVFKTLFLSIATIAIVLNIFDSAQKKIIMILFFRF